MKIGQAIKERRTNARWKIIRLTDDGEIHIMEALDSDMFWYRPSYADLAL